MDSVRGFVKSVGIKMDKDLNPVVLVTVQTTNIESATELFKDSEVIIQSAQGKLALAKE